jgi:hypothetical protein
VFEKYITQEMIIHDKRKTLCKRLIQLSEDWTETFRDNHHFFCFGKLPDFLDQMMEIILQIVLESFLIFLIK